MIFAGEGLATAPPIASHKGPFNFCLPRALISEPKILPLDEPPAGLSPLMMHEVFEAIRELRDEAGMCILMVEQNAFEALHISDTAYVLSLSTVAIEGVAAELLADPAMRELYLGSDAGMKA